MSRVITWNGPKADANYRKHGIRFEDAAHVFDDPLALSVQDRIEGSEQRWQTIGQIGGGLIVAHTVELSEETEELRIISARRADKSERTRYENG